MVIKMKKILPILLALTLSCGNVCAFGLEDAAADTSYLENIGADITGDMLYARNLVGGVSQKYVVSESTDGDISAVDAFYEKLSAPITVSELDGGKADFDFGVVCGDSLKRKTKLIKSLAGLGGYTAEFEPLCIFNIYRDLTLVCGYSIYTKTYQNSDDAYWQAVCAIENMSREVVPYQSRIALLNKFKELDGVINSDKQMKMFILKDGKINSVWERGD